MTTRRLLLLAAVPLLAVGLLSGCAEPFRADVARFHAAIPPPEQGQSFTVMPANSKNAGSLEFAHYADLVAAKLVALGYVRASDPAAAKLVVTLDYGVGKGVQRIRAMGPDPFYGDPFYADPFFYPWPYYPSWHGRFIYGWSDPFLWGPGYGYGDVDTYIVYHSHLKLKIDKAGGGRVFEGTAQAQSLSNHLTYLVPNLIDAIFTGFPGKDGEDIKVTVAPEPKTKTK